MSTDAMLAPEAQKFLERMKRFQAKSMAEMTPLEARDYVAFQAKLVRRQHPHSMKVMDIVLKHYSSDLDQELQTPLRFYRPNESDSNSALIIYFHGGGFVAGNCDYVDPFCHLLAKTTNALVVSVDYHLAPEYPYPFAVYEGFSVCKTLLAHSEAYRFDSKQVSLMGDSAGANLAAVITNLLSQVKPLLSQVLLYPTTDFDFSKKYDSHDQFAHGYFLTKANIEWSAQHYLQDLSRAKEPLASPVYAKDLRGLSKTLIITAEYDPLRDEGRAYASHLVSYGVEVYYHEYSGMIHCFATFIDFFPVASVKVVEEVKNFLHPIDDRDFV